MKQILASIVILALGTAPSFGKTLDFPNSEHVMFKVTIPDKWEPDADEDEVVEATSPDGKISLSIWELESEDDVKNILTEIGDLLKEHATDVKLVGKPQKVTPGGMDAVEFNGSARDKEDGHAIEFHALLISSEDKAAVVYVEADAKSPKADRDNLQSIMKSITPPGGKKVLHASLALDQNSKPTSTFAPDAPQILAFFHGTELKAGDKVKGVWMVDDVGDADGKNVKMGEAEVVATSPTTEGNFSLTRSKNLWPVGQYHVDILVNDKLVTSLKYKVVKQ